MSKIGFLDGDWARDQMQAVNATQDDLASAINRDRSIVSRIVTGQRRVSLGEAPALAEALGVSVLELLGRCGITAAAEAASMGRAANDDDLPTYDPDALRHVVAEAVTFVRNRGLDPTPEELGELVSLMYEIVATDEPPLALDDVAPQQEGSTWRSLPGTLLAGLFRRVSRVG